MVVLKVYNKDNELISTLDLKEEDLMNPRFKRKNSVLDILLNNGVNVHYGCMGGSCSACVCEMVSGEEFMDREGISMQIYKGIEENQFLSCIASIKENAPDDAEIKIKTAL